MTINTETTFDKLAKYEKALSDLDSPELATITMEAVLLELCRATLLLREKIEQLEKEPR